MLMGEPLLVHLNSLPKPICQPVNQHTYSLSICKLLIYEYNYVWDYFLKSENIQQEN